MLNFILGILSSIVAVIILFFLRYNFGFIISFIFYKLYPNISGEYNYYAYNRRRALSEKEKNTEGSDHLYTKPGEKLSHQELLEWLKDKDKKPHIIIKLKQFAYKISGEVYCIQEDKIKHLEKINGKITPSRVLVLNSETIDGEHHNFGTYLLNLTNDLSIIRGTRSGLCVQCGDATSDYVLLEKNNSVF